MNGMLGQSARRPHPSKMTALRFSNQYRLLSSVFVFVFVLLVAETVHSTSSCDTQGGGSTPPRRQRFFFGTTFGEESSFPRQRQRQRPKDKDHGLRTDEWELSFIWTSKHIASNKQSKRQILRLDVDPRGFARLQEANHKNRDDGGNSLWSSPVLGRWSITGRPDAPNQDKSITIHVPKAAGRRRQSWTLEARYIHCPWGSSPRLVRGVIRATDTARIIGTFQGRGIMGSGNSSDRLDLLYPERRSSGHGASGMAY